MLEQATSTVTDVFAKDSWNFNAWSSVLIAILVLLLGKNLSNRIEFLKRLNLPDPVVGGVVFSVFTLILYLSTNIELDFQTQTGEFLMLAFFSTVGLGANLRLLKRGGKGLIIFLGLCIVFLICQNTIGVTLASIFGLDPRIGLLSGSITLTGGHGTGKVYGDMFAHASTALTGATDMALACATFGLILGGIVGAPVSRHILNRFNLKPTAPELNNIEECKFHSRRYEDTESVSTDTILKSTLLITLCVLLGDPVVDLLNGENFILPDFVGSLFVGIIICNLVALKDGKGDKHIHQETLTIIGNVSLAIFLAMAMMKIRLWELAHLAGPLTVIMIAQTVFIILFAIIICFRVMGKDFDAAIISGGFCGFGLGSTLTAIANMDSIVKHFGPAPRAFLIVPLVGAFSIDIINALIIQCYLALPWLSKLM